MVNLINGLGGPRGFGENILGQTDDGSSELLDITSVFENGIDFYGEVFTGLYINANGSVTFQVPRSDFTPTVITEVSNNPEITPFFADVDTRDENSDVFAGSTNLSNLPSGEGTSTGSAMIFWDFDLDRDAFTVTWDDVGYFDQNTDLLNAFQLTLFDRGEGNFDMEFRYEAINWTTGDASQGQNGLGGTAARAGWTAGTGNPEEFFELPQSGNGDAILELENARGNTGEAGLWTFEVRDGVVEPILSFLSDQVSVTEGDAGETTASFTVSRDRTDISQTISYTVGGVEVDSADGEDFVGGFPAGEITFDQGVSEAVINIVIQGDTLEEADEGFEVVLANGVTANGIVLNDDDAAEPVSVRAVSDRVSEGLSGETVFSFEVERLDTEGALTLQYTVESGETASADIDDFVGSNISEEITTFAEIVTMEDQLDLSVTLSALDFTRSDVLSISGLVAGNALDQSTRTSFDFGVIDQVEILVNGENAHSFDSANLTQTSSGLFYDTELTGLSVTEDDVVTARVVVNRGLDIVETTQTIENRDVLSALPNGLIEFADGQALQTVLVRVNGDAVPEADENFRFVVEGGPSVNATIENDDVTSPPLARESSSATATATAQNIALIYEAAFNRNGMIDAEGLNFWIDESENGLSDRDIAFAFLNSDEFRSNFGDYTTMSAQSLVQTMYRNVLDREGEEAGVSFWNDRVASDTFDEADLLLGFANSQENQQGSVFLDQLYEAEPGYWDFL